MPEDGEKKLTHAQHLKELQDIIYNVPVLRVPIEPVVAPTSTDATSPRVIKANIFCHQQHMRNNPQPTTTTNKLFKQRVNGETIRSKHNHVWNINQKRLTALDDTQTAKDKLAALNFNHTPISILGTKALTFCDQEQRAT